MTSTAAVTVTPDDAVEALGPRESPTTLLGMRHRDYSDDDSTDDDIRKRRNKKRRSTSQLLNKDSIPKQNDRLPLPELCRFIK